MEYKKPEEPVQYFISGFVIMNTITKEPIFNPDGGLFKSEEEAVTHIQSLGPSDNPYKYILVPANDHISLN